MTSNYPSLPTLMLFTMIFLFSKSLLKDIDN